MVPSAVFTDGQDMFGGFSVGSLYGLLSYSVHAGKWGGFPVSH